MYRIPSAAPRFSSSAGRCASQDTAVACEQCGLDPICRVLDYGDESSGVPAGILLRRQPVARGAILFRHQQRCTSIYAVKSGSFKTFLPDAENPDQVLGFQLAGELIGAEAITSGRYPCTARALEASSVCELHLQRLVDSGRPQALLQQAIIDVLGGELAASHRLLATLVQQSAEQRVAGFLLNLSDRLRQHGMSADQFDLSMSRSDIGSYLGLAGETVSRVLGKLHEKGLIQLRRKRVSLNRRAQLEALCAER